MNMRNRLAHYDDSTLDATHVRLRQGTRPAADTRGRGSGRLDTPNNRSSRKHGRKKLNKKQLRVKTARDRKHEIEDRRIEIEIELEEPRMPGRQQRSGLLLCADCQWQCVQCGTYSDCEWQCGCPKAQELGCASKELRDDSPETRRGSGAASRS